MEEIFKNISEQFKTDADFIFNMAINAKTPIEGVKLLNNYTNSFINEEKRDFLYFYFNMRLEALKNEDSNNKR